MKSRRPTQTAQNPPAQELAQPGLESFDPDMQSLYGNSFLAAQLRGGGPGRGPGPGPGRGGPGRGRGPRRQGRPRGGAVQPPAVEPTPAPAAVVEEKAPAEESGARELAPVIDQHAMNSRYNYGYCGVATVLSTLQGVGKDPGVDVQNRAELDAFAEQMYIPGSGSDGGRMAMVLRDAGEENAAMTYGGSVPQIMETLKKGKPVPVGFASMGGSIAEDAQSERYGTLRAGDRHDKTFGDSGHWATVVGFEGDPKNPTHFLVNDSDTGTRIRMTRSELERHTKASEGIWMVGGM